VDHLDSGGEREGLGGEVCAAARAGGSKRELPGLGLRQRDQLVNALYGHRRVRNEHQRERAEARDAGEIAREAVGQLGVQARVRGERGGQEHQRVAVRRRARNELRADVAVAAAAVVDHELLAERLAELDRDQAAEDVGGPTGRERNHEPHRPRGVGLRRSRGHPRREGCDQDGAPQKKSKHLHNYVTARRMAAPARKRDPRGEETP
jgi:hypothetical protein